MTRNFYEKVAKISDESFKHLQKCPKLRKIELVYSRKFDENIGVNLSRNFHNLKVLNLA